MRFLALMLLVACDRGTTATTTGGLRGVVGSEGGPQTGVIVDVSIGTKKYEATTGEDGRYSIELAPGEYKVAITLGQCGKPKLVEVKAGEWIDLDWKCWIKTK